VNMLIFLTITALLILALASEEGFLSGWAPPPSPRPEPAPGAYPVIPGSWEPEDWAPKPLEGAAALEGLEALRRAIVACQRAAYLHREAGDEWGARHWESQASAWLSRAIDHPGARVVRALVQARYFQKKSGDSQTEIPISVSIPG